MRQRRVPVPGPAGHGALAAATGIDPDEDPWLPERSVWPLLEVVDECLDEPWLATLARHLEGARGDPEEPPRRFGVVRHIADLFDRYGVHRPGMVRWAAGRTARGDGLAGRAVAAAARTDRRPSPAERLSPRLRADPRAGPSCSSCPPRLALFGLTRLPRSYLDVLARDGGPDATCTCSSCTRRPRSGDAWAR